eukprot:g20772.t1
MTGAVGQRRVPKPYLEATVLPLPPLAEQKRIVAKLDALSARSARARKDLARIDTLVKRYQQAVLSKAFCGDLTKDWRTETHPSPMQISSLLAQRASALEALMVKSKPLQFRDVPREKQPFAIPDSWVWLPAEVMTAPITKGTTPKKEEMNAGSGDVPFVKVYNLTFDGSLDFTVDPTFVTRETHCGFLKRSIVKPGDVLMNIVGPPLGKVSIVPETWPEWNVNQAIAIFRSYGATAPSYLAKWLLTSSVINWAKREAKATAGQSNLTLEICRALPFPICSLEEQIEIVHRIESAFQKIDRLAAEAKRALELTDKLDEAILAKAFRGELVPQDPTDEPASALLERIKAERATQLKAKRGQRQKA